MIISAFVSSFCIGLFFFLVGIIFEPNNHWSLLAFVVAFLMSFFSTLIFGIPVVKMLNNYNKLNWTTLLLSGFLLGFIITFLLFLFFTPSCNNCSSIENGKVLMLNGSYTVVAWIEQIKDSMIQGVIGMCSSAIFYKTFLIRQNKHITGSEKI